MKRITSPITFHKTKLLILALALYTAAAPHSARAGVVERMVKKVMADESSGEAGAVILGDPAAVACDATTEGAIKYVDASNRVELCDDNVWIAVGSGANVALSALTAAGATNTINNAAFAQEWQWNTLAGGTGLKLSSTSTAAASNTQKLFEIALSGASGTAAQTTYGAYITNTHTNATSGTNVGLYASASGATTANYAAIFANGNVGIGTTSPARVLHLSTTNASGDGMYLDNFDAGRYGVPGVVMRRGRGTASAPTAVQANDWLGFLGVRGYGATGFNANSMGYIVFEAAENHTDTAMGTRLMFATTPAGTIASAERMRITDAGNVGIGTATPLDVLNVAGELDDAGFTLESYNDVDLDGATLMMLRGRGTEASPTIVQNGDEIGHVFFRAYDGAAYQNAASIVAAVDGTPGAGDMPTRLDFHTSPDGGVTHVQRMTIKNNGNVGIGDFWGASDSVDSTLHIQSGDIRLDGGAGNQAGCIRFDDTTDKIQFSHDCTTFTDMGGASGIAIDNLTDAFTDYTTNHNFTMGRASAGALFAGAQYNTFIGELAGPVAGTNASMDYNLAVGYNALTSLTTGASNTAVGNFALTSNTTGNNNNAFGESTLGANTTGGSNSAYGTYALSSNTVGYYNTAVGNSALNSNVAKAESTAIGFRAMQYADNTTTAATTYNTALGAYALRGSTTAANNTGGANTAIGHSAMIGNTSGYNNAAVGYNALAANTTGTDNVAIGTSSLAVATASSNVAVGSAALMNTTIGDVNVAIGKYSMMDNTTGQGNVAIGMEALKTNVAKAGSVAIGYGAMQYAHNSGTYAVTQNTAVGHTALRGSATPANNTGVSNTAIGYGALTANTSGIGNTALGDRALVNNTTAGSNVAIGYTALYSNTTGGQNVAVGSQAGYAGTANVTGAANTFIGADSQATANNLTNATAIGYGAIVTASNMMTLGNSSVTNIYLSGTGAVRLPTGTAAQAPTCAAGIAGSARFQTDGEQGISLCDGASWSAIALNNLSDGYTDYTTNATRALIATGVGQTIIAGALNNLFVGPGAGSTGTTNAMDNNTGLGVEALDTLDTGANNTAVGYQASYGLSSGSSNTAVGYSALWTATSSSNNTAVGYQALANTTAGNGTAVGRNALLSVSTGGENVGIGESAGYAGTAITTGQQNTFIGTQSQANGQYSNATAIGYGAIVTGSNYIQLGNAAVTRVYFGTGAGTPVLTAGMYVTASDMRLKKDIQDSDLGLDFIESLRPVSYRFKQSAGSDLLRYGFIAQEVEKSLGDRVTGIVTRDDNELKTYALSYTDIIAPLVKAVQEQQEQIELLKVQNDTLRDELKKLKAHTGFPE